MKALIIALAAFHLLVQANFYIKLQGTQIWSGQDCDAWVTYF